MQWRKNGAGDDYRLYGNQSGFASAFGDRITPGDFDLIEDATPIARGQGRRLIESIATDAHIKIIEVG